MKTAFDEIIRNKNKDNIDLNQYKLFLKEYNGDGKEETGHKEEPEIEKRKRVMKVSEKPKSRNLNEEDERKMKKKGEEEEVTYDEWLPPSGSFKRNKL